MIQTGPFKPYVIIQDIKHEGLEKSVLTFLVYARPAMNEKQKKLYRMSGVKRPTHQLKAICMVSSGIYAPGWKVGASYTFNESLLYDKMKWRINRRVPRSLITAWLLQWEGEHG